MLLTTRTIKKIHQEQETNAEENISVEPELQGSVLSITICPFILNSLKQTITPSKHKNTNMRALDIQQSLVTNCLCIYDITVFLA